MATEIISGILQTLFTEIGKKLVHKIKNQITHLCCHKFYIQRLTEEVQKLEIERQTVQQAVDVALRNLESIRTDVEDWLTRSNDRLTTSHEILDKVGRDHNRTAGKRYFLKWLPMVHYSLSVEAQKEVNDLIQLQIPPGSFEKVSNPSNPADLQPVPPSISKILLSSRGLLEKQIMDALKDDVVYLIGLCSMGGVGKTTIATHMKNWAKSSSMFEVVIFTVISQRLDIKEVQKQIAEGLGLTLEEHSQHIRAEKIHARLKAAKSFLIIFDDVWETFDLAKIGIPSKSTTEKRKLILTSRNQDALTTITNDCYKIFTVEVLPDEDAWKLFREKAGDSIEAPELVEIAKQVAGQCKGLPIALVVVGSALRGKSKGMWEDALIQLKRSHMPSNIPRVRKDLYVPLKWSYEQLPSEEVRYIFLLCCLFPEDAEIATETLVRYGWGLGIFINIKTMREARNRVSFLFDVLKSRFLLTQAENVPFFGIGELVKVHDVIRDMGILIACTDRHMFMVGEGNWPSETSYENITHISVDLNGKRSLPETLDCPRLEFLHIRLYSDFEGDIPEEFFSSMKGLKLLSARNFKTTKLPSSISKLRNLRAIYLEYCLLGKMELVFENTVNLEIISLRGSHLEVLPRETGQLKHLKVLDLTYCEIISIESGVISSLVQLEELLMVGCGFWKGKEDEEKMRVLAEIGSLSSLVNLQIQLWNPKILSLDHPFLPKLERFLLVVERHLSREDFRVYGLRNKVLFISCKNVVPIMNFILPMIRNAEGMEIEGDCCFGILNELSNVKFRELKLLSLLYSKNVEYLVVPTTTSQSQRGPDKKGVLLFPTLQPLCPECSENREEFCFHQPHVGSLRELHLQQMDGLKQALPISKFQICSHLEVLKIFWCGRMEHIFGEPQEEEEEGIQITTTKKKIKFLRLRELYLYDIGQMEVLFKGIEEIELPALQELRIVDLPKLTNFTSTPNYNTDDDQFFFSKKILCPNLKTLKLHITICNGLFSYNIPEGCFNLLEDLQISFCNKLKNVMTPSLSKSLKNLKRLHIYACEELEEVIMPDKEQKGQTNMKEILLFPRLQELKLRNLPKICTFCHISTHIELPSSLEVTIRRCPLLKTFSLGSLSCPSIKVHNMQDPGTNIFFSTETSL